MFYQCHLQPRFSEIIKLLRTSSRTKDLSISSSGVDALGKLGKIRVFQTSSRAKGLPFTCSKALPLSYKRNQGTGPITERSDSEKKKRFPPNYWHDRCVANFRTYQIRKNMARLFSQYWLDQKFEDCLQDRTAAQLFKAFKITISPLIWWPFLELHQQVAATNLKK